MNCVLALAGVEFGEEIGATTVSTTWKHYSIVLRDLRSSVSRGMHGQERKCLHLLLVTLFLGMIEVSHRLIFLAFYYR